MFKYINADYNHFSFFELHGLADLVVEFLHSKNINTLPDVKDVLNNVTIDNKDLLSFFKNEYSLILSNKFYMKMNSSDRTFSYFNPVSKVNSVNNEYLSTHIIDGEKSKDRLYQLLKNIELEDKGNKLGGSVSPFASNIFNVNAKSYQDVDSLFYISSLVEKITPNKFCFYDRNYNAIIPDLGLDLIKYIEFNYTIRKINNDLGYNRFVANSDDSKAKSRSKYHYQGNMSDDYSKYSSYQFRLYDIYSDIYETVKNLNITFTSYDWYLVTQSKYSNIDYNNIIVEHILQGENFSDDMKNLKRSNKMGDDKHIKNVYKFLNTFNFNYLQDIIQKRKTLSNNKIIQLYIKTISKNMNTETIKEFTISLKNKVYYSAKENVERVSKSNNKDAIELRKNRLLDEISSILKRSKDVITFVSDLSEFLKKHKIYNMFKETHIDYILSLSNEEFSSFQKIVSIYLFTNNYDKKETEVETQEIELTEVEKTKSKVGKKESDF